MEAAILAILGMSGSVIAARVVTRLFFRKGGEKDEK